MNLEENRLNTFRNWPTSAEVEPIRIAKAGFFYTGQGVEVQCFSCGGKISEWNYGDQVMARHRRLDPNCPFVVNPQVSGNVPLILNFQCPSVSDRNSNGSGSQMFIEDSILIEGDYGLTEEDEMYRNDALRLLSFINWPVSFISRESLVSAGFYYAGDRRVRCAWCGGELAGGWRPGDVPLEEHRRHFPRCAHAAALAAPPPPPSPPETPIPFTPPTFSSSLTHDYNISDTSTSEDRPQPQTEGAAHNAQVLLSQNTWRTLGVFGGAEGARHPARASHASRLATYTGWPSNRAQTPHELADAGFFYTGTHDQVRCFYCDGGLGKWEAGDVPWTEHARWFPLCGYVLLVKGKEFVESCRVKNVQRTFSADTGLSSRRLNPENNANFTVTESQIEEQMESSSALAALGAGLDAARVRRAIRRRLRSTGAPFNSSEALIDAVLDEQLSEEAWSASPRTHDLATDILHDTLRTFAPAFVTDFTSRSTTPEQRSNPARSSSLNSRNVTTSNQDAKSEPAVLTKSDTEEDSTPSVATSLDRPPVSLEEENRQLKEARLCKVCMDNEVSVVFLPCGHLVSCAVCGASLAACPLCRGAVRALVRAYLA